MKRIAFVLAVLVLISCAAWAQEVEPRGFDNPSTTETAEESAPIESAEPTPETPAAPANAIVDALSIRIAELENQEPQIDTKKLDQILAQLQSDVARAQKPALPWYAWLIIVVLFAGDVALFLSKAPKAKPEPRFTPEPQPEHTNDDEPNFDRGFRRGGPGATALILSLIGIGMIASSAHAECKITSISNGSVLVKEQKPAPITIALAGCDKDVKSIVAAASGVSFTDVKSEKGKVVAKVTADKSAETGPALVKVTFTDATDVASKDNVFVLILDPQTAVVRKDAAAAKAEASTARKEVKTLEAKVEKVAKEVATRPTIGDVKATVSPLETRIAQLESEIAALRNTQAANTDRIALLSRATELLAEGQSTLANKRIGFFRRPLNKSVAASADKVREAVAANN